MTDPKLFKYVGLALVAQGFECFSMPNLVDWSSTRYNYIKYSYNDIAGHDSYCEGKEFTVNDVFDGTLLKYSTKVDTNITFADGTKVELSIESYNALRG